MDNMSSLDAGANTASSARKGVWVNGLLPAQGPGVSYPCSLTKTMYRCPLLALCLLLRT